jgi:DNA-binding NtrC family response regulator
MKKLQIEPKALEKLASHNWTGNIRELRNVIERLVILSENNIKESDIEKFVIPK